VGVNDTVGRTVLYRPVKYTGNYLTRPLCSLTVREGAAIGQSWIATASRNEWKDVKARRAAMETMRKRESSREEKDVNTTKSQSTRRSQ